MKLQSKTKFSIRVYGAFLINGIMALLVGAILPYIIEEKQISYSIAGSLLSAFAIGNLAASFINPVLCRMWGRKKTVTLMTSMIPICFLVLTLLPSIGIMYLLMVLIGIGRGSCSIFSNAVVNDNNPDKPSAITLLHTIFAVGAFLAPFITTLLLWMGYGWKIVVYLLILLWIAAIAGYGTIEKDKVEPIIRDKNGTFTKRDKSSDFTFLKNKDFFIMGFLLFFYLGVENCINGWFITYFKDIGIMSDSYAANLVSIVWIMVMLGRICTAKLSYKWKRKTLIIVNCFATAMFFLLLIATSHLIVITIAIVGLGFFLAGIYPTCISSMGEALQGSTTGMSYLLAMAALGGIIAPKMVGVVADNFGMGIGIGVLGINVVVMVVLGIINYRRQK